MSKREAEIVMEGPPTKKGGFRGMDCPFTKSHFLANAKDTTMRLTLNPKKFRPGGYGYQKCGGTTKIEVADKVVYVRPSCIANVLGSKYGSGLPEATFLKEAKAFEVTFDISPVEFSTGSFGWMAHRKQTKTAAGSELCLQVNFNAPIVASKEKGDAEEDPVTASIDPDALKQFMPIIGSETAENKDDLTKIRGIGPWIEKRLNKIRIFTFRQISLMTPKIVEVVNDAIKYFEGRVHRDEWVLQAQKIIGGKWDELNPLAGKATGKITIGGEAYENKLIQIANDAMEDGVIEHFEAEALWFRASDGNKITPSESKTLHYIMTSERFKLDEDAKAFLESKLASLDARGVTSASRGGSTPMESVQCEFHCTVSMSVPNSGGGTRIANAEPNRGAKLRTPTRSG